MKIKIDPNIQPNSYDEYFNLIRTIFLINKFNTRLLNDPDFISHTMYRLNKYEQRYDSTKANRWTWYTNHIRWSYFAYIHKQNKNNKQIKEYEKHIKYINKKQPNYRNLYRCIALLNNFEQEILQKYHFEGYTLEEISKDYSCTRECIRLNIKKIYQKLKQKLEDGENNDTTRSTTYRITSRNQLKSGN